MTDYLDKVMKNANRVVSYDAKHKIGGGYELAHKPSSYGLVIKYLLYTKKLTYAKASKMLGITAQGLNHMINRTEDDRFDEDVIDRYCNAFKINKQFFKDVASKVREILENK